MTTWRRLRPSGADQDPVPVGELLDGVTRSFGAQRAQVLAAVFARWPTLVGREIAAHAQPRSLRQGVLVIGADQPAWAAQLRYLTGDLLTRIRSETGAEDIDQIRITVDGAPSLTQPTKGVARRGY